jgi:hypothetical protein
MMNHWHRLGYRIGVLATLAALSSCGRRSEDHSRLIEPLSQARAQPANVPSGAPSQPAGPQPTPTAQAPTPAAQAKAPSGSATAGSRPPEPAPASPYPVRWSPELKLESLASVPARLAMPDGLGFGELELGEQRVLPATCKQWAELRSAGYEPSTNLEVQPDGGAMVRCETLRRLQQARPAQRGFVRDLPKAGREWLAVLPVAVATAESAPRAKRVEALTKQGKALVALDPKAKVEQSAGGGVHIAEGDGQSVIQLTPEAWADFDGDGIDDVAMAVVNSMTAGSYSTARLLFLTRGSATDVLRVIDPG